MALSTSEVFVPCPQDIPGVFPAPLIAQPTLEHRQTFIILHGRGSFAARFGPPLLAQQANLNLRSATLQEAFPHAKIVFPTAARSRATIYKRAYTHQWFDNWHLEQYVKRQDLMGDGLGKSVRYVHGLLEEACREVGAGNVVLWGLSQGCATCLVSLLCWEGEGIAACVGMCGWLPYGNVVEDIATIKNSSQDCLFEVDDEDDATFASSGSGNGDVGARKDVATEAVDYIREEINMQGKSAVYKSIPVFLGHGTEDDKVSVRLGREAKRCLELLGLEVKMNEYEGLGHWYSDEMLGDIFAFLKEKLGG